MCRCLQSPEGVGIPKAGDAGTGEPPGQVVSTAELSLTPDPAPQTTFKALLQSRQTPHLRAEFSVRKAAELCT